MLERRNRHMNCLVPPFTMFVLLMAGIVTLICSGLLTVASSDELCLPACADRA